MANQWNDQQRRIIEADSGNVIASASAGSGKTAVMLERIMRLLTTKRMPLSQMVVLAYNQAIAIEIKSKVRDAITKAIADGGYDNVFLAEQLDCIDSCNICTIDSYCSNIIKEFFELIKIDPKFSIMSEIQSKAEFGRLSSNIIKEHKDNPKSSIYDLILIFGGEELLIDAIRSINDFVGVLPDRERWLEKTAIESYSYPIDDTVLGKSFLAMTARYAREVLDFLLELQQVSVQVGDDRRAIQINEMISGITNVIAAKGYQELIMRIDAHYPTDKIRARKNEDALYVEHYGKVHTIVRDLFKKFSGLPKIAEVESQQSECLPIVRQIVGLANQIIREYTQYKATEAMFDFADLTFWAIALLDIPAVSEELKERYKSVSIDEFQDANYCQDYILSKITNNNLFVVGDTKQSIYKFRHAEPTILIDKFRDFSADTKATAERLNYNYRSDGRVLENINRIFDKIMTPNLTDVDYLNNERLISGKAYQYINQHDDSMTIKMFCGAKTSQDKTYCIATDIYDISKADLTNKTLNAVVREGEYIADMISQMVGRKDIYIAKDKSWRKVRYSDITILARARNREVEIILQEIAKHGIPIDAKSLERGGDNPAIEKLNDFLRVIDNDRQDFPLASALTTCWGGMTFADIANIKAASPATKYFYESCLKARENNGYLTKFYNTVDRVRLMLSTHSLYEVINHIVYDLGYFDWLGMTENGDNDKHILKQYIDTLKDSNISLSEMIRGLDKRGEVNYEQYPRNAAKEMVTTSTIHASKGLEYPIVFLIDCCKKLTRISGKSMSYNLQMRREEGIAINKYDALNMTKKNSIFIRLFNFLKVEEEKLVAMRLFYVALTRASNHLFITGNREMTETQGELVPKSCHCLMNADSFMDWILYVAESDIMIRNSLEVIACRGQDYVLEEKPQNIVTSQSNDNDYGYIADYINYRYPHEDALELAVKYTVTEINQMNVYEDEIICPSASDQESLPTVNTAYSGTNYHKILEHIDYSLTKLSEIESALDKMCEDNIITKHDRDGADAKEIFGVINSEIIKLASRTNHLREQKFMLSIPAEKLFKGKFIGESVLVQGAIDLVIIGDKEVYLVDFKKSSKSPKELAKNYSRQLEIYALAIEEALGRPVDHKIIFKIGSNQAIEI